MDLVNHILSDPEQALFLGSLAIGALLLVGFFVVYVYDFFCKPKKQDVEDYMRRRDEQKSYSKDEL